MIYFVTKNNSGAFHLVSECRILLRRVWAISFLIFLPFEKFIGTRCSFCRLVQITTVYNSSDRLPVMATGNRIAALKKKREDTKLFDNFERLDFCVYNVSSFPAFNTFSMIFFTK